MPPRKKSRHSKSKLTQDFGMNVVSSFMSPLSQVVTLSGCTPSLTNKRCTYICKSLLRCFDSHIFSHPVDHESLMLHDYTNIIKEPMDLNTLHDYTRNEKFEFDEFLRKLRLIWSNAMTYNPSPHILSKIAERFHHVSEELIQKEQKYSQDDDELKISNVFGSLISYLSQEDVAEFFVDDIDIKEHTYYPSVIAHPMSISLIADKIQKCEYCERHQILHDFELIERNSTLFNGNTSIYSAMGRSLLNLFNAVHSNICDDVCIKYMLTFALRNQLVDNIIHKLNDEDRLKALDYLKKLFSLSVDNHDGNITSATVEFLNLSQFVKLDIFVRKLLVNSDCSVSCF